MAVIGELSAVEQLLGRCANRFLGLAKKSQDEANAARKEIGGSRIVAQASHKEIAPRDLPTACGPGCEWALGDRPLMGNTERNWSRPDRA
jgi:hypothetical protein